MISRRNIRVKVMQTVYTLSAGEGSNKTDEPIKLLQRHFDQSKELFIYIVYFLTEIAAYAERDSYNRSSKHLPSAEDLNVNTKISGNEWIWKIREDAAFSSQVEKLKPSQRIDRDLVRRIYQKLSNSPEYIKYIFTPERTTAAEKDIIEFILGSMLLENEDFIHHIEEEFINWDDDADMVVQLTQGLLQKPASINFNEVLTPDKWTFAKMLIQTLVEKKEHLEELIVPKLKNWDAERLAALDLIILKMGVAEFLYFDTIPPKVTINEYIDIAKEYSTPQSGQFVNGILDNIHKELVTEGKLQKTEYKKS